MSPPTLLVTSDGQWVLPDSDEFLKALGDPNPDYDAVAFAVKNLGFIKLRFFEQAMIEIELHPRNVQLPALLAAQQQLLSAEVRLFRVKYLDETAWRSEISSSAEQVIARLSELCAPAFEPPRHERFHTVLRDFASIFDDEANPLRPVAQKWRVSFGHFDPNLLTIALQNQMLSRLMIVGVKPQCEDPVWRFIGGGQRWIGQRYQVAGIGEKVTDTPDRDYGEWLAEFYKTVARTGQPRYELVTAQMQYEDEPGKPRRTASYERLLLPWKTPSDEVFVTGCARLVENNDSISASSATDNPVDRNDARSR